jgi:hypothetical protein
LDAQVSTPFQRHIRPFELLLLAVATWLSLNRSSRPGEITQIAGAHEHEEQESGARWNAARTMAVTLGAVTAYLAILAMMFSLLEPEGVAWTVVTAGSGLAAGTAVFLLVRWARRHGVTRLLSRNENASREGQ